MDPKLSKTKELLSEGLNAQQQRIKAEIEQLLEEYNKEFGQTGIGYSFKRLKIIDEEPPKVVTPIKCAFAVLKDGGKNYQEKEEFKHSQKKKELEIVYTFSNFP